MNYTSAALGVIGVISLLTWVTTGHKAFTGPTFHDTSSASDSTKDSIDDQAGNDIEKMDN